MLIEAALQIIMVFISLICMGAFAYILTGKSKSFDDAFKQFITDIQNIFVGSVKPPQQPPVTYKYPPSYFTDLTANLKPFFNWIKPETAYQNEEHLQVPYTFNDCQTDILIIEAVFESFIREVYNINQSDKVFIFAQKQGMHLILTFAISDKCKQWVQQQDANRKSRQIPQNEDLVE